MDELRRLLELSGCSCIQVVEEGFYTAWTQLTNDHSAHPLDYDLPTMEYQYEYFSSIGKIENLSMVLIIGPQAVAVWPVFQLVKAGGDLMYTTNGGPLMSPLFSDKINSGLKDQIAQIIDDQILNWTATGSCIFKEISDSFKLSSIHRKTIFASVKVELGYAQIVDLGKSEEMIFADIRKSFKSLVNKSERLFDIRVWEKVDDDVWQKFKSSHFREAGKKTRSDLSWSIQFDQVNRGEAVLITAEDQAEFVGFALFNYNQFQSLYAVGVYDRSKFDLPIGHGIQWKAIRYFKSKGVKQHMVGLLPDNKDKDPKVLNIAKFKSGFGNPYYHLLFSCPKKLLSIP